ncbi:MAG: hypothetical protein WKF58_09640 [Ilumatobacteraceae bacterium]
MIWSAALLAGGAGLGLWLVVRAWFPAARPLDVLSAELASPRRDTASRDTSGARGWWSRLAPRVVTGLTPSVLADMSVVGTTPLRARSRQAPHRHHVRRNRARADGDLPADGSRIADDVRRRRRDRARRARVVPP